MKAIIIILFLIFCSEAVYSQYGRYRGSESIQLQAGFTEVGLLVSGRYVYKYLNELSGEFGVGASFGSVADLRITIIFIDGLCSYRIYDRSRILYVNLLAGISFSADVLNKFKSERIEDRFFITYGAVGGLQTELKVLRSISFLFEGQQRYYFQSTFSEKTRWRFHASLGIRVSL